MTIISSKNDELMQELYKLAEEHPDDVLIVPSANEMYFVNLPDDWVEIAAPTANEH